MNKPVYLGLSILGISKKVIYEFWFDFTKKKQNYVARIEIVL